MRELDESMRRKPGATGRPVVLADGEEWLLAIPRYRPRPDGLTRPMVDGPMEGLFEGFIGQETVSLTDIWEVAAALLLRNYEIDGDELAQLLSVSPGDEAEELKRAVLDALFGTASRRRGYGQWVRASLLANGLGPCSISADDLPDVMSILIATNRTVPLARFADACREAQVRASLEALI